MSLISSGGARFADPETGELCPVHNTVQRSWEHLRFFVHRVYFQGEIDELMIFDGHLPESEIQALRHP